MKLDDGQCEGDGHIKMDQVLHIWKRRKRKIKINLRQRYFNMSHFLFALKIP
jgi:hypothetical protein